MVCPLHLKILPTPIWFVRRFRLAINHFSIDFSLVAGQVETYSYVFLLHGLFVLEHAGFSNQRDFFSSWFTRFTNTSNQISRIRVAANNLCNKNKLFSQCSSLLRCVSISSLLNKSKISQSLWTKDSKLRKKFCKLSENVETEVLMLIGVLGKTIAR